MLLLLVLLYLLKCLKNYILLGVFKGLDLLAYMNVHIYQLIQLKKLNKNRQNISLISFYSIQCLSTLGQVLLFLILKGFVAIIYIISNEKQPVTNMGRSNLELYLSISNHGSHVGDFLLPRHKKPYVTSNFNILPFLHVKYQLAHHFYSNSSSPFTQIQRLMIKELPMHPFCGGVP